MNKDEIDRIRVHIEVEGKSALAVQLTRDGKIIRFGNGSLPAPVLTAQEETDGNLFRLLLRSVDDKLFASQGVYDHPRKKGKLMRYCVLFGGKGDQSIVFDFRLGLDNKDVGKLLPYFDKMIMAVVALTEDFYQEALARKKKKEQGGAMDIREFLKSRK